MKRISTIVLLCALAVLVMALVPSVAFANAGPHGGYISNTEACAGCHRAHTAPSSITWTDRNLQTKSALLLTTATQLTDFCLQCHDTAGQGAGTNVLEGIYYGSVNGTDGADLISGPFGKAIPGFPGYFAGEGGTGMAVTSSHITSQGWPAYGGGILASTTTNLPIGGWNQGGGDDIPMDCGTCHDPHGSSNYRILKDEVYGVAVGGYDGSLSATNPIPTPFVLSNEPGFPVGGFLLHVPNTALGYTPNYTTPMYAKAPTSAVSPGAPDPAKGMTGWCIGCHTVYASKETTYNAADGYGYVTRHRHPMNVPLSNFAGPRSLIVTDLPLPLAHDVGEATPLANQDSDWIDCLTCHNAHGTTATMSGWANNGSNDPLAANFGPDTGIGGVPPVDDSALLKLDNRGVCESCHNK